jgi:hypothetical protein
VLVIGGLLAVLGPTLIAVAGLINAYTTIKGALLAAKTAQLGLNLSVLANPYVAAAAAVAVLVGAMVLYKSETDKARQAKEDFDNVVAGKSGRSAMDEAAKELTRLNGELRDARVKYDNLRRAADAQGAVVTDRTISQLAETSKLVKELERQQLAAQKVYQTASKQEQQRIRDTKTLQDNTTSQRDNTTATQGQIDTLDLLATAAKTYDDILQNRLEDIDAEYKITGDLNTRIEQTADAYRDAAIAAQRLGDVERAKELKALMQGQGAVAPLTPVAPGQIANPALQGRGLVVNPADAARTAEAAAYAEQLAAIDEIVVNLGQNMEAVGAQFGESLGMLITGAEGAEEALKATARAAIDAAFNAATALAIQAAGQTAVGSGPAAAIILPALITAGMGLIKSVFTNLVGLATGGLTTGPMLAMIGDNPSGKEAVIPFERMGEFLQMAGAGQSNANVTVTGRLQGRDLVISNERTTFNRNRTKY